MCPTAMAAPARTGTATTAHNETARAGGSRARPIPPRSGDKRSLTAHNPANLAATPLQIRREGEIKPPLPTRPLGERTRGLPGHGSQPAPDARPFPPRPVWYPPSPKPRAASTPKKAAPAAIPARSTPAEPMREKKTEPAETIPPARARTRASLNCSLIDSSPLTALAPCLSVVTHELHGSA